VGFTIPYPFASAATVASRASATGKNASDRMKRADLALQTVILSKNQAVAVMTGGFDYVQPPERQEPQPSRREPKPLTEALEGSKGYGGFESLSHLWRPQPPVESFIPILNM